VTDLLVITFADSHGAHRALAAVRQVEDQHVVLIDDIAVVEHHHSGRYSTHTTHGSVAAGVTWGGLTGLLIGLLFPPAGIAAVMAVGVGGGALFEKAVKLTGLPADALREIRDELSTPGTSALVLIGPAGDLDQTVAAFEPFHPSDVSRRFLTDDEPPDLGLAFV
jgi:uncharacterized membrane protein